MPRFAARPALALMGALALLCLTACAPTATASVSPTATFVPAPTARPTLMPAPTPTNVPSGWTVLDTQHFSLAYPPNWTPETHPQQSGPTLYDFAAPDGSAPVRVEVLADSPDPNVTAPYCLPASSDIRHTAQADLPVTYMLGGEGLFMRTWIFANAQRTVFSLDASDANSDAATQAQDEAVLATFRPDDATPWQC